MSSAAISWIHQHGVSPINSVSFALLFCIPITLLLGSCYRFSKKRSRLPPSPPRLPIIGNLHQLSSLPHRSLRALSQQHGPLMFLRLGQVPTLVVSSAAAAQEIMKTHDVAFAGRPSLGSAGPALQRGGRLISFTSYGDYWRQAKKACVVHLLNPRRVRAFRPAREEEVARLLATVAASAGPVDLGRALSSFSNAVIGRALFGREKSAEQRTLEGRIAEMLEEQTPLIGGFQVDDFFPSLRWLNALTGKSSKVRELARHWYAFLDRIVDRHVGRKVEGEATKGDFVDALLSLHGGIDKDFVPSIPDIKVILLDLIAAGTDTSYETMEWAMAELVRSPAAMKKLQEEIRGKAGGKPVVTEDDVEEMPFFKSTIKETLRLHPPAPLLLPRVAMKPVQLKGYDVPMNTRVVINAWAIARDPASWESPEEFRPERFLESSVDFGGNDFQFIPFGAGRRICPGMHFATSTIELALANLLHHFDWGLPDGMSPEDLDMQEAFGITVRRKASLRLVAKPTRSLHLSSCSGRSSASFR